MHVLLLCHLDQASNRTTSSVLGCRLGGAPRQQQLDIVHKFHLFNYYFADFSGHFFWTRVYSPLRPPPVTPPFEEIYFAENKLQFWGVPPTHKSAKYYLTSSLNHTQIWISLKIFTIYLIFWPLQYYFLMFVLFLPKIIPTFLLNIDPLTLIHRIQINYNFSIHP